jgi:hypothetical protein
MKFALELLHHVMKERIEAKTALRKAVRAQRPGQLMKDITVEDLGTLVARMDDDEYLREVRIKLIGEGKLVSPAVVTPTATFAALSSSVPTGSPPGHIAMASQLARPDSPQSPSPAGRSTQSGKSLKTIAILQKNHAHEQEAEADEEEEEEQEGEGEREGEGEGENKEVEVEVDEEDEEELGEQQGEAEDEEEQPAEGDDRVEEEAPDEGRQVEIPDDRQHCKV